MDGGNAPFDAANPRYIVSAGPIKWHVTEAAKWITAFDFGLMVVPFFVCIVQPIVYTVIFIITLFIPAVFALLAAKNGNPTHAMVPFIFSCLWLVVWSSQAIFLPLDTFDIYKSAKAEFDDQPRLKPFAATFFVVFSIITCWVIVACNFKVHLTLWRFNKEQSVAKVAAPYTASSQGAYQAPTAYQGSYQGYDAPQPQLVQNNVY